MVINGIDRIKISVRDIDESVSFYKDVMQMSLIDQVELPAQAMQQLWNIDSATSAKAAYLKNDEQATTLELIQFTPISTTVIRAGAQEYDYGLYDVAFRANDIDAIYKDLTSKGYKFVSEPIVYTADWVKVTVKEVIMVGPDQMPIALIERMTDPKPQIKGRFGTMLDCAQFVEEIDTVCSFYTDVLGYTKVFDSKLPDGLIDGILNLPKGTKSRMAFLMQPNTKTPVVELIQTTAPAKSLADVIRPPHIGLFGWSMEVADLNAAKECIEKAGYPILSPIVEMTVVSHGNISTMTVQGPNHNLIELFQKKQISQSNYEQPDCN